MAHAMLSTDRLPEEVNTLISTEAEGNQFFVEEILKTLLESGVLRRSDRQYTLSRAAEDIVIPDTVQDVIMARIDRLDEVTKKTLQFASVIGRHFSRRLLDHIPDLRGQSAAALEQLRALEFIHERSRFHEPAYTFTHALTCEVAYGSLLVHRRKELHHVIGTAIERHYADRLAEQYEVLAYHFSKEPAPAPRGPALGRVVDPSRTGSMSGIFPLAFRVFS